MLHWHAITMRSGREEQARKEITGRGFAAYLPLMKRRLSPRAGGGLVDVPRFPGWVFGRFDPDVFGWELIGSGAAEFLEMKIRCNAEGWPIAVPTKAVEAMKAYKPAPPEEKPVITFKKGQPILHYTAGIPQQAVFLRYTRQRAHVELWILGRPRTVTVAVGALEEMEAR